MRSLMIFMLILSLVLVISCETAPGEVNDEVNDEANDEANDEEEPTMGLVEGPLPVDGSSDGYTTEPMQVAGTTIFLAHDGSNLYVHLQTEGEGWVAVGLNTRGSAMDGANMVLGYLDGETPAFRDDVGRGFTHSEADTTAVEEFYLSHDNGTMVMEFSYPLTFQDGEGYNIEELTPGETYTLIVARHNTSSDISRQHTDRGSLIFIVEP